MICIERSQIDPYLNMATEEYVLKNISEDVFMLWQNRHTVVIGKHQNALAEINMKYVSKNNIPVIRRISGGGTVYHDEGNINYTVITSEKNRERLIDFKKFTQPLIDFLKTLDIDATYEGKNNLVVAGKKVSGNSAHVFKNRVMHHGTLLFISNLDVLDKAIHPAKINIEDKAVQSIRATVDNVYDQLKSKMEIAVFKEKLGQFLLNYHSVKETIALNEKQLTEIAKLADEKYRSWDWNYGYSPAFTLKNKVGDLEVELQVKNGLIKNAELKGKFPNSKELVSVLIGIPHNPVTLRRAIIPFVNDQEKITQLIELFGFF